MGKSARPSAGRTRSPLVLGSALVLGACSTLWALDDLHYDRPTGTMTSTGAGAGGLGGQGGATPQPCPETDCQACTSGSCATDACITANELCAESSECTSLQACVTGCGDGNTACAFACVHAHVDATDVFYAAFNCLACAAETCAPACTARCQRCSAGLTCTDCVNQPCMSETCAQQIGACDAEPECGPAGECYGDCLDEACMQACATQFPIGAPLYLDIWLCAYCTKAACYDDCLADGSYCTSAVFPAG